MSEQYQGPYDDDRCHFKFKGCTTRPAGYQRREDGGTKQYFDACENCARVPYKNEELQGVANEQQ